MKKLPNYYKGWDIFYSTPYQRWRAIKHGVTMTANKKEELFSMIDNHIKTPWPTERFAETELTKEDIYKYGTKEEIEFLLEGVSTVIGRELLKALRTNRSSVLRIMGLPEEQFKNLSDINLYMLLTKTDYEDAVKKWYNSRIDPSKMEMEPPPFGGH